MITGRNAVGGIGQTRTSPGARHAALVLLEHARAKDSWFDRDEVVAVIVALEPELDRASQEWLTSTDEPEYWWGDFALFQLGRGERDPEIVARALEWVRRSPVQRLYAPPIEDPPPPLVDPLADPRLPTEWIVPEVRRWLVREYAEETAISRTVFLVGPSRAVERDDDEPGSRSDCGPRLLEAMGPRGRDAASALAAIASYRNGENRSAACRALGAVDESGETAPSVLMGVLRDAATRRDALEGLAHLGPHAATAVDAVVACLADVDPHVRETGVELLGQLAVRADDVVPALERRLHDSRWEVRQRAAWALGEFGSEATPAVSTLRECLRDADARVVWQVRKTLQRVEAREER